jgi:hypothetical protein
MIGQVVLLSPGTRRIEESVEGEVQLGARSSRGRVVALRTVSRNVDLRSQCSPARNSTCFQTAAHGLLQFCCATEWRVSGHESECERSEPKSSPSSPLEALSVLTK